MAAVLRVSARGGMTHAAVVTRGTGKCCVAGTVGYSTCENGCKR